LTRKTKDQEGDAGMMVWPPSFTFMY